VNLFCLLVFPSFVLANAPAHPIAEVVKLRGEATQLPPTAHLAKAVNLGDKFVEDTSIVTGPKSFIKIKFIDNSELNVGPESKIVITEMKKDSVGIISLLKGRIRTEVEKDANPNGNKFFIKTRTAALGVRGTDFQTIYNPDNKMTSLLTYRGEVAMAKVDEKTYEKLEEAPVKVVERDEVTKDPVIKEVPAKKLDEVAELNKILSKHDTVLVPPGQNSFSSDSLKKASLPVKISPVQLEALNKNTDFQEKNTANLKLADASKMKTTIAVAEQKAPLEGLYNAKTGDFAPKSGGFIDLNTGLYVAPADDAKLDTKSGVYVANTVGNVDADTGQYVAPKGLTLDAKKGFVLQSETEKAPELLALKEDMNKTIARDIVVGEPVVEKEIPFNVNEKFIRDRLVFSIWGMSQEMKSNANRSDMPFVGIKSNSSARFAFEWDMATNNRFSPTVNVDYSIVNFSDDKPENVSQESKKLMGLAFGTKYALSKNLNLFGKFGLHQEHFFNQTANSNNNTYDLQRIVLSRLSAGVNAEFFRSEKWSLDTTIGGLFTFRKRINTIVVNPGGGFLLEILPKYRLKEKQWLGLGFNVENQTQKVEGATGTNYSDRKTHGFELKYMADI
jgi:hypothetical protein